MVTMSNTEAEAVRIVGVDTLDLAERERRMPPPENREVVFDVSGLSVRYGSEPALKDVSLQVYKNFVTAFIGPSGCGKSTFIRCFNRMNDLIPSAVVEGTVLYHKHDLYGADVDPVEVRKRIGMVFQKPNPFPKSIYDNVAFGPRVLGMTDGLDERVERALQQAALWDEVKGRLKASALGRSAAAPLYRPLPRRRARRPPHGRACFRARPDRDYAHRGPHARPQAGLHDRDRHTQHAAGSPHRRHDRVLQRRRRGRPSKRRSRRVRHDTQDLYAPLGQAN
jgi:ABC-type oligopeptide transport system ATPase subunit